jgi:hypothetical protein
MPHLKDKPLAVPKGFDQALVDVGNYHGALLMKVGEPYLMLDGRLL